MNQNLNQELESLIAFFWQMKKLSFSKEEYPNIASLEKEGIIKNNGNQYTPANYALLAPKFLEYYQNRNVFEYSSNFSKTVIFIKKLKDDFFSNGYVQEFYDLGKEIWKVVIVDTNKQFYNDFNQYITALNKDDNNEEIFEFIEAYNDVISELDINAETLYKNAVHLKKFAESDATYNMPLGSILLGLKKKSESDENVGTELLQFALQRDIRDNDIISAVVAGMYNKLGYPFYQQQLVHLLASKELKVPVINGLSNIDKIQATEANLFIALFDQEKQEELSLPGITKLLFSALNAKNDFPGREKYVPDIFYRINEIVLISNGQLTYFILHEIAFLHKYNEARIAIVEAIIHQPYFSLEKYSKSIEQIFWYLKDVNCLKRILLAIADNVPLVEIRKKFSLAITNFDKPDLDKMLVELLVSNKAIVRCMALQLLSLRSAYQFDIDLLALAPIEQYKLWMAITQDYKEPIHVVSTLAPLLKSKSGIVREALICKMEEYTENYGGAVISALEKSIDKSNTECHEALERIKNYKENYYKKYVHVKREIQELNPYYTHHKLFSEFNTMYHKDFTQRMQENMKESEKNSFLSMVSTIQLAKGGGWKIPGKEDVAKLGSFESSLTLPRTYFIFPDQFEMQENQKIIEDWNDEDFEELKKCIKNE